MFNGIVILLASMNLRSREWEPESEGNCYDEKTPIELESYWGSGSDQPTMRIVEKVVNKLSSEVTVLNITQLSEYRKDGHPSIYRKFWEELSPQQLSNPASYSDCIHWCLPGVPDVWNELLFHFLWNFSTLFYRTDYIIVICCIGKSQGKDYLRYSWCFSTL